MGHYQHRFIVPVAAAFCMAALAAGWATPRHAAAQGQPQKVVLRFAADFPPPPHPAGLAMRYFADRLPQVIPGSEARLYFAGALYTVPEAFEAMRQGNLEMTWMQIGKAAPVDPWMMAVVGPGVLTTVGAVDNLEKTKTYQMLIDRLEKKQLIKVFGAGHMSFGMGVGGKRRYARPEDFVGKKVRSMGPVENAALESWKANPVVMGFGEVPNAMESGVIDGLMTSLGGWNSMREQAPYYTMGGAGAFVGCNCAVARSVASGVVAQPVNRNRTLAAMANFMGSSCCESTRLFPAKANAALLSRRERLTLVQLVAYGPLGRLEEEVS